jgi:hypothetical protein
MLINSNSKALFSFFLTYHILVKKRLYLCRFWNGNSTTRSCFVAFIFIDYLVADINAFIANINARSGDELSDFILRFSAERTTQGFF